MKKLILTATLFLAGILCMNAQEAKQAPSVDQQTTNMTTKLTSACSLTADQATKIKPFVQKFVQTRADNKQKYASDPAGMKEAMKADRQELATSLKTVLSADQMTQFKNFLQQQMKGNQTPHPAGQ
jgi:hypothetical protein